MKKVTDQEVEELIKSDKLVVIDCYADWCRPCQAMKPILESLAEEFTGTAEFYALDVDNYKETPIKYNVRSLPTLLLFKSGILQETLLGLKEKSVLREKVQEYV
jgi:thioredoxin 1